MRYWIVSLVIVFFVVAASESQDTKKKDKDADKKKEVTGKDKDKDKDPKAGTIPEVTEVLGKSFKEWQVEIHSTDPGKRETAMKMIFGFGNERAYDAVPDILQEMEKHTIGKVKVDLSARVNGTMVLSTLFKYKKDPDPKHIARAVAVYRAFLNDDQLLLKIRTVQGLPYLGPASRQAFPEITRMASPDNSLTWEARKEAVQVMGFLGFTDTGAPNPLWTAEVFKALNDTSYQVRIAGLHAVMRLVSTGTPEQKGPVIIRINKLIDNDLDTHVVITGHLCVMSLEKKYTGKHLNPILKMMKVKDSGTRLAAVQSIALLGKEGKAAVPALLEAIHDPEVGVGVAAIQSLLSTETDELASVMKKLKNDKSADETLQEAAEEALQFIAQRDKMRKEMKEKDKKGDKK